MLACVTLGAVGGQPAGADPSPSGTITGTLTTPSGSPAADVNVYLWDRWPVELVAVTTTDSAGEYDFQVVDPGSYNIEYVDSRYERILHGGQARLDEPKVVVAAGSVTDLSWQLRTTASISGLITDTDGVPIEGARVRARISPDDGASSLTSLWVDDAEAPNWSSTRWSSTMTGADGRYTLSGLSYGGHAVEISAPGYATTYWDGGGAIQYSVFVARGQQVVGVDAELGEAGRFTGTVTDGDGAPVAGIEVVARAEFSYAGDHGAVTGTDGTYEIDGASTALNYTLEFLGQRNGYSSVTGVTAGKPVFGSPITVDRQLVELGRITGTLVDGDGAPVADMRVSLYDQTWFPAAMTMSEDDGSFDFGGLDAKEYSRLIVGPFGTEGPSVYAPLEITAGLAVTNETVTDLGELTLATGATIGGQILDGDGAPAVGVNVTAASDVSRSAVSGSDGRYLITGLPDGEYGVSSTQTDDYIGTAMTFVSTSIAASPNDADITVMPRPAATGTVTDGDGAPVPGLTVTVTHSFWGASGITADDGTYRVPLGNSGTVSIKVLDPSGRYGTVIGDQEVEASVGAAGIDLVVAKQRSIAGVITGPGGVPLEGVHVGGWWGADTTGSDGSYLIWGNNTGEVTIDIVDDSAAHVSTSRTVSVADGAQQTTFDVELEAAHSLSGRVSGPSGESAFGYLVEALDESGAVVTSADTTSLGSYALYGLPAGSHVIRVVDQGQDPTWGESYYDDGAPLTHSEATSGLDITLVPAGSISGRITDTGGSAVRDAEVTGIRRGGTTSITTWTDSYGDYTLQGLGSFDYEVFTDGADSGAEWFDDALAQPDATPVEVSAGADVDAIDFVVAAEATLSGIVVDRDGIAVPSLFVRLMPVGSDVSADSQQTDENGAFEFTADPGSYQIVSSAGTGVGETWYGDVADRDGASEILVSRANIENLNIEARYVATGTVSGAMVDGDGQGSELGFVTARSVATAEEFVAIPDGSGEWSLVLPAGRYEFEAYGHEAETTIVYGGAANPAQVLVGEAGTVSGIELSLTAETPIAAISGVVTDVDDEPIAGIIVETFDDEELAGGSVATAADGTYQLLDVAPGDWTVKFTDATDAHVDEFFSGQLTSSDTVVPTTVVVASGTETTGIDAQMSTAGVAPGDAVVAKADNAQTLEDVTVDIDVLDNDEDASNPTVTIVVDAEHGSLTVLAGGKVRYAPAANWHGNDSFRYQVCTEALVCDSATVSVTVVESNDTPTVGADAYSVASVTAPFSVAAPGVLANDEDVDGDSLTAVVVSQPTHGSIALRSDGGFTYTPDGSSCGTETFRYRAADELSAAVGTVTLTITCPTPPTTTPPTTTPPATPVRRDLPIEQADTLAEVIESRDYVAERDSATLRLYRAFFDRDPDLSGAKFWLSESRAGINYDDVAWGFANSTEFQRTYGGDLTNRRFLEIVYTNVLGRTPDAVGFEYWLGQMDGGLDKHLVVRWVAAGSEFEDRFPYLPER